MKPHWTLLVLAMAVGSMGAGPQMAAHTQTSAEAQTTAQLLQEVRALRTAIERMTVSGTRAQLLLGRLQMQEQRMTSLGQQLQETRTKLANLQRQRQQHVFQIERFNEIIEKASTPEQRAEVEMSLPMMKQEVKQLDQQMEALQAEDAGLTQALSADQARWVELNARLEELEALLATQKP